MEKIKEEVPEKLRIAVLLSFISGYINAFTYNNAGELFAGAQTGNVIFMALHFAKGNLEKAVVKSSHFFIQKKCKRFLKNRFKQKIRVGGRRVLK